VDLDLVAVLVQPVAPAKCTFSTLLANQDKLDAKDMEGFRVKNSLGKVRKKTISERF
jgi:hypothetical protein